MATKYLDDEDYFECSGGLFPARINDPKNTYLTVNGKKYLTHYDTATKTPDFTCKWAVILAVAAAVFFALLASNPIGWAILAGLAVGVGIGMAMCGVMMAMGRKWIDPHTDFVIEGAKFTLTTDKHMVCALGGEIRYSPTVTPSNAMWTGLRNLGFATLEGVMYGYGAYGATSLLTVSGRAAFFPNLWNGIKMSWTKWEAYVFRVGFAGENIAYNSYSGNYTNEDGSYNYGAATMGGATTFAGDAYAYYNLGNKIYNREELSVSDVTVPLTMPFAFGGANIQQTKANNQIPKKLRDVAGEKVTPIYNKYLGAKNSVSRGLFKLNSYTKLRLKPSEITELINLKKAFPKSYNKNIATMRVRVYDKNGNLIFEKNYKAIAGKGHKEGFSDTLQKPNDISKFEDSTGRNRFNDSENKMITEMQGDLRSQNIDIDNNVKIDIDTQFNPCEVCDKTITDLSKQGADVTVKSSGQKGTPDFDKIYPEDKMNKPN